MLWTFKVSAQKFVDIYIIAENPKLWFDPVIQRPIVTKREVMGAASNRHSLRRLNLRG